MRVIGQFIGNRQKHLFTALSKLRAFGSVNDTSYLYDTKPMYECNQNRFLNAVCKVETSLSPVDLLRECKRIEKETFRGDTNTELVLASLGNDAGLIGAAML